MCAIANGMAAYSPGTFIPVTSTFFMFYLYAAPAVRMGALQRLQVIHAATHDSIGAGEDGPTHQPVELAALYRSMPELLYIRPGDSEEAAGAWEAAVAHRAGPSIISTSRHKLPQLGGLTRRGGVARGAYCMQDVEGDHHSWRADVTLIGAGAELSLAVEAARLLRERRNIRARVVSFPCWRLFERQAREYRRGVLRRGRPYGAQGEGIPAVVVEPYSPNGWERYADAGVCMRSFGHSLPGPANYGFFGFEPGPVCEKVIGYLEKLKTGEYVRGEFVDL